MLVQPITARCRGVDSSLDCGCFQTGQCFVAGLSAASGDTRPARVSSADRRASADGGQLGSAATHRLFRAHSSLPPCGVSSAPCSALTCTGASRSLHSVQRPQVNTAASAAAPSLRRWPARHRQYRTDTSRSDRADRLRGPPPTVQPSLHRHPDPSRPGQHGPTETYRERLAKAWQRSAHGPSGRKAADTVRPTGQTLTAHTDCCTVYSQPTTELLPCHCATPTGNDQ